MTQKPRKETKEEKELINRIISLPASTTPEQILNIASEHLPKN